MARSKLILKFWRNRAGQYFINIPWNIVGILITRKKVNFVSLHKMAKMCHPQE